MYLTAIKYGATAAAGAFVMWLWHSSVVSEMQADTASQQMLHAIELHSAQVRAQKQVAKIEQYHYDKMQRAIAAIPEPRRVFVRANCPSVSATDLPGVDTGERAELNAAGRSAVLQLRRGIVRVEEKLTACQALLIAP
jgi:hypothetical protein